MLLTAPDMNSATPGTYASRTMRVKISGVVLSTQSALPPSGLPELDLAARGVDTQRPLVEITLTQREIEGHGLVDGSGQELLLELLEEAHEVVLALVIRRSALFLA